MVAHRYNLTNCISIFQICEGTSEKNQVAEDNKRIICDLTPTSMSYDNVDNLRTDWFENVSTSIVANRRHK